MHYISTRGGTDPIPFSGAILSGLTPDGGLLVPEVYPQIKIGNLAFFESAVKIMAPFASSSFNESQLLSLLKKSWSSFPIDDPAPFRRLDKNLWVLELFHGPTLAFKDYGLQFLATLFEEIGEDLIIIGATSGDTGAAAVHALAGKKNVKLVMLHPEGRISEIQRRQMTTVKADNVFNIAVEGSFDDCQKLLKAVLVNREIQENCRLSTINSINWGRILAQSIYYWWTVNRLQKQASFIVPSGNFGNAFSGYVAMRSGAQIKNITIATNKNDILPRALKTGTYKPGRAEETLSPAMDIQEASNFERLLFEITGHNTTLVSNLMSSLRENGEYQIPPKTLEKAKTFFNAFAVGEEETLAAIRNAHKTYDVILDPHTAVGLAALQKLEIDTNTPVVLLATAHPAKFPDAIAHAIGTRPSLPPRLSCLMDQKERFFRLGADTGGLVAFVKKEVT